MVWKPVTYHITCDTILSVKRRQRLSHPSRYPRSSLGHQVIKHAIRSHRDHSWVLIPSFSYQPAFSSLFCHLPSAGGQVSEVQDMGSLPVLDNPSLTFSRQELTCSEFSGYSCRTARAPRTCKKQRHHCLTNTPWGQDPDTLLLIQ